MIIQVTPEGEPDSKICFIEDIPTSEDVVKHKPLSGPIGHIFNRLLAGSKLFRTSCYITTVLKSSANNDTAYSYFSINKEGQGSVTPAGQPHYEHLIEELKQCKANVFVPLGKVGLWVLTGETEIHKWRGSQMSCIIPGMEDKKVIPTLGPKFALKDIVLESIIKHDLAKIRKHSEFPENTVPYRKIITSPSYSEIIAWFERVKEEKLTIGFDIEVINLQISCLAASTDPFEDTIVVPFMSSKGEHFSAMDEAVIMQKIGEVLEDPDIIKVMQNGMFDCSFIAKRYGIATTNVDDTMIAHGLLVPDFPKGLGFMVSNLTDEPYYKDEGKESFTSLSANDQQFWLYNGKDASCTLEVFYKLKTMLEKAGTWDTYVKQKGIIDALLFMQTRGILIDTEGVAKKTIEVEKRVEILQEKLNALTAPEVYNIQSPKQMKELFYVRLGYSPYKSKTTGKATTNDDALKRIAKSITKNKNGCEEAKIVRDMRKHKKYLGSYLTIDLDFDNRTRSSLNPIGTTTGRISSSKTLDGIGFNMQTAPYEYRRYMIADPGYIAFAPDLGQAENRIVAYLSQCPAMMNAFEQGIDVHKQTYGMMFGIPTDEVSSVDGSSEFGDGTHSQRYWGKQCNHALNYGLGYKRFAFRFDLREKEARHIVELYHRVYPEVRSRYHTMIQEMIYKNRTIVSPMGRKRIFLGRIDTLLFMDAYACLPQGVVADIMNDLLGEVQSNQEVFKHVEQLMQVHDSLWYQIPAIAGGKYIIDTALAMKENAEREVSWGIPFTIPLEFQMGLNFYPKAMVDFDPTASDAIARMDEYIAERF